jgi:hypothetical protein
MVAAAMLLAVVASTPAPFGAPENLASVTSFDVISDTATRSAALFTAAGKVLTHPRCVNCHPASDRRQSDVRRLHQTGVERARTALDFRRCAAQSATKRPISNPPGGPDWHLTPRETGWEGKPLGEICAQIKAWVRIIWSAGPGRRAPAVSLLPARKPKPVRRSTPG